jgi:hypothetical protein
MRYQTSTSILHLPSSGAKQNRPKYIQKNPMFPEQFFIAGQKFLSQQAEDDTDDQYNPPEEIDTGVQS